MAGNAQQSTEVQAQLARNTLLSAILVKLGSLGIQIGPKFTTATAGALTLPSNPATFIQITATDGTVYKIPGYNP